jgi:hypothetical protein
VRVDLRVLRMSGDSWCIRDSMRGMGRWQQTGGTGLGALVVKRGFRVANLSMGDKQRESGLLYAKINPVSQAASQTLTS